MLEWDHLDGKVAGPRTWGQEVRRCLIEGTGWGHTFWNLSRLSLDLVQRWPLGRGVLDWPGREESVRGR